MKNNKILIIVESASKCKKIEQYLGSSYKCIACFGHIREIKDLNSIDFNNNYKPLFKEIESKKTQINKIRKEINSHIEVILASDNDREGESIAWHICDLFNLDILTTKRITFNEITYSALQTAIKNPKTIDMNLVNAQIARQILDLIIGFKITPILWKYVNHPFYSVLSAGRCQTPALRLIYDNQMEINNIKENQRYNYKISGLFTSKNITFSLQNDFDNELDVINFLELSKNYNHIYNNSDPEIYYYYPPSPLTTSKLQQDIGSCFHISPKETMIICQKLYENGYITYMRTDSKFYSIDFINSTKQYILSTYGEKYLVNNIYKLSFNKSNNPSNESYPKETNNSNNKSNNNSNFKTQEAHEAIRPTNINLFQLPQEASFNNKERNIYKYIWKNSIQSLMSPCSVNRVLSTITTPIENINYKNISEIIIFDGWKKISTNETNERNNNENNETVISKTEYYNYLLNLPKGSFIKYNKIKSIYTLKNNKEHYNESKLVKLLESKGIGRPSTFSTIIDKIQSRTFVKRTNIEPNSINCIEYELINKNITKNEIIKQIGGEKNKLVIEPIGISVLTFLIEHFNNLFEYNYTKRVEDDLDEIANGNKVWYDLCKECDSNIISQISLIKPIETPIKKISKREKKVIDKNNVNDINIKNNIIDNNKMDNIENENDNTERNSILDNTSNNELNEKSFDEKIKKGIKHGIYENNDLYLKIGRYGLYAQWGDNKKSLNGINIEPSEITHKDIVHYINKLQFSKMNALMNESNGISQPSNESGVIRILNESTSIRTGKYGDYIFYKPKNITKPEFINLKKYKGNYKTDPIPSILEWITKSK